MLITVSLLFAGLTALAEEYPIFDGRKYNGLFYPRVDIIEWGAPLHLEFNIYSKDKPVELSGQVIERGGRKVFAFAYDLPFRKERLCRTVIAPPNFKVGQPLHFYVDKQDKDLNKIIVSAQPLGEKKYAAKKYDGCIEQKAQIDPATKKPQRAIASTVVKEKTQEPKKSHELPVWFDEEVKAPQSNYNWYNAR